MPFYPNPVRAGLDAVASLGDGLTINVKWFQAEHSVKINKIAYHIYYSTIKENVFTEGVKYASIDGSLQANIIDLTPGQDYFFSVRPIEYDPTIYNLDETLPIAYDNLRAYPHSILRQDISASSLIIPLLDVEGFPNIGIIKAGAELIQYLAVDTVNKNLIVAASGSSTLAQLVDQGGGHFYLPNINNIGAGTISNLSIVGPGVTETWTIRCIFAQLDDFGNRITKFISIGSISGTSRDGYADPIIWSADNNLYSNKTLQFSINNTSPFFKIGDEFIIKVNGGTPGATGGRGYNNTIARTHSVSGFDGYYNWDPTISLFTSGESTLYDRIFVCQSRFEYPNYPFTMVDGYHQTTQDLLSTDLTAADAANVTFPMYDFAGYHRTDPVQLLNGTCVGSYIGGEMGCIDGYGNISILRGLSLQDQNTQRQDLLLSVTGKPAVLLKRRWQGITSNTYLPSSEYPDDRGLDNYGGKYVYGYDQYFNPRRSDGRILVRPGPTTENLKMREAGLESEFPLDLWSLTVPTIKTRDILVLFDQDDNEEFRYEVSDVIRNNTILGLDGGQHLKVFRIRKFDPAYQIRIFRDTAMFPSKLNTSIGFTPGIPPHVHVLESNEKIMSVSQINQTTSVSQGHSHPIKDGVVLTALGHTHEIIIP